MREAEERVRSEFALRGASETETVMADMIVRGTASRRSALPARGVVDIDGERIEVAVVSEGSRVNLNDATREILGPWFERFGVSPEDQVRLAAALQARRDTGQALQSPDEIMAFLRVHLPVEQADCLAVHTAGGPGKTPTSTCPDQEPEAGSNIAISSPPYRVEARDVRGGQLAATHWLSTQGDGIGRSLWIVAR